MESNKITLPPNPYEKANILSKRFFTWVLPFFKKSYECVLDINDIYRSLECDSAQTLGHSLEQNWNKRKSKSSDNNLLSVVVAIFWKEYLTLGLLSFVNEVILRLGQPFLLGYLLQYFQKASEITNKPLLVYATGIVTLNVLNAIIISHINYIAFHSALRVRVAIRSLIYRKSLRLSQSALDGISAGKIVNFISNGVNHFELASYFLNYIWLGPLLTMIVAIILCIEMGYVGLIGIVVVLLFVPPIGYGSHLISKYHLEIAEITDERIRLMKEIIAGAQVIKMYAWEKPFAKLVSIMRKLELKGVLKIGRVRVLHLVSIIITYRLALFFTMLGMIYVNDPADITAARIFAIQINLTIVAHVMSQRFSRGVTEMAEVLSSFERIQLFLSLDEKESNKSFGGILRNEGVNHPKSEKSIYSISMRNATAIWSSPSEQPSENGMQKRMMESIHQNDSLKVSNQVLVSSLKQRPTLNNLSLKLPVGCLIGVIGPVGSGKSSLLQMLLKELPIESGYITINGTISYSSQKPWLFPASIRQNILFGAEYDYSRYNAVVTTCALIKDFRQFKHGDNSIVGERGAILSGGQQARINLARACYRNAAIYLFDDPLSAVDTHVGAHIFEKCIGPNGRLAKQGSTRVLVTHQVHFLKQADWIVVLEDGKIVMQGTPFEFYGDHFDEPSEVIEENISSINHRKSVRICSMSKDSSEIDQKEGNEMINTGPDMERSSKGTVKGSLLVKYFCAGVHWSGFLILIISFLVVQVLGSGVDYWVSVWITQERLQTTDDSPSLSAQTCILVQFGLLAALVFFTIARTMGFYDVIIRVANQIHHLMFHGVILAPIRFFDTNPAGRILNRFSKDLKSVDEMLPKYLVDSTQNLLSILGSIVIVAIANPIFLAPVIISVIAYFMIRMVYLKASTNLRRLEGMTLSPILTHITTTLNDLSTVRACNNQDILQCEFDHLQDVQTACSFMILSIASSFILSLDFICALLIACVTLFFVFYDTDASAEICGLSISQTLLLTGLLSWGARQNTDAINETMSVERALEYDQLEPEIEPKNPLAVSLDWPSQGRIEFRNVFYRYFSGGDPVLKNLSFVIESEEKIGVVGRTGAGKSSLIGSLFRLGCIEGEILIDGVNTANIQLFGLRKQIAIIPQDPVLFPGTLRRNLDPFDEYTDSDIWSALESVELKQLISDASGLNSKVLPQGSNYSIGQRQLLCLSRALLKRNRILVLDEATANVDPQTDIVIQRAIREKFRDCTVLTVAHRLNTIIDSDRVLVMDTGKAVEFDKPYKLLQNEDRIFHSMVRALGNEDFNRLSEIAMEKFVENSDGIGSTSL